jgi:hypothetical protein
MMRTPTLVCPEVEILLNEAIRNRLYGTIEVKFESGRVVLIKKSETLKPADDRNTRDQDGYDE